MPNIFKRFLQPNASDFVFPDVEELVEEEAADTAGEQEGEPEESAPEAEEKDTPSAVDFAQIQAEKILEDARRQAEDYLVRRQMEAEQEAEQVRQQAQSEGYRQGYAEGLRQAGVEGQAELQKQREQQAEELQAFLEKATAAREELLRETRGELCELSLAIAEKVIHVSLNSSSEVVARMIQVATEKLKRREWVHIYVGGCAAKEVSAITPELMTALAGLSDHIKIIPLSDDEAGISKARFWATQAREPYPWYEHKEIGYNYRMSNIVAGIGRGQLIHLLEHRTKKEAIYRTYEKAFQGLPVRMNPHLPYSQPNFWLSCMTIDPGCTVTPEQIRLALEEENIESRPIWKPMHLQPVFAAHDFVTAGDNVGEDIFARGLCLPSDIKMADSDQERVISVIRGLF